MEIRVNKKEFIYLFTLTVYLSELILELTVLTANDSFSNALKYVRYFCYLLAVIKILIDLYDAKNIWRICIILIITGLMVVNLRSNTYFFFILMIIAAKDVNFQKILRQACWVQGIMLAVFVTASQIGLVENFVFLQERGSRYSLGFVYTSVAPEIFFFFTMCYIYLRKDKMRIYEFAVLEVINYWFFIMTQTRLFFYIYTIMLVYVFLMRYFWQNRGDSIRKNKCLILAPAVCCVGAILLHICYNSENEKWVALNKLLSGRLNLGKKAFETFGITWFGQNIQWMGHSKLSALPEYNYVDSAYMQMLLECGIIFLVLIVALYTYMMYMAVKTKDFYLQTMILLAVIISITDPRLLDLAFNPLPLLAAAAWSLKKPELLDLKEPILVPKFKIQSVQIKFKNRI